MKRFIEGEDRQQVTLLPECLDDYIAEDKPLRVVDAYVGEIDLVVLGFAGANPAFTGRPSYHPSVLLKLYIYGSLNRIQSSQRLERECQCNVELMWLMGRLTPDFKTIADFRHDNGKGIGNACRQFVELCRGLKLFSQAIVAIDSSKFKAVNSRDRNFTPGKIDKRMQQIEESINRYLEAIETADRTQRAEAKAKTERIQEKIGKLRQQMRDLAKRKEQLGQVPDGQISETDPDSRSMVSQAKGTGTVGYNVQTAVDAKHRLIVAHEVPNVGSDRSQLSKMAVQARDAMGCKRKLQAIADRGYYRSQEILACDDEGITPYVPKSMTSTAKADGRYSKDDLIFIARDNEYQCPAGQRLRWTHVSEEDGLKMHFYRTAACSQCPQKAKCTTGNERRVRRWEYEAVLEAMQRRLAKRPEKMVVRRSTVEHVFGTLKFWMGTTHFLTKTLEHASTEMSLNVLAYNIKRVIGIMGIGKMMQEMKKLRLEAA